MSHMSRKKKKKKERNVMGNCLPTWDRIDEKTGMTSREKRLVRESWRRFCERNPDYGVLLFLGMFTKHPQYIALFRSFRGKNLRQLNEDPTFRAHAYAVGHQLSAMVESLDEPSVFIELIRKNAANHRVRQGVRPANFEGLFSAVLEEMVASDGSVMTPATVKAWERLFETVNIITKSVFDEAPETSPEASPEKPESPGDRPPGPTSDDTSPEVPSRTPLAIKTDVRGAPDKGAKKRRRKRNSEKSQN